MITRNKDSLDVGLIVSDMDASLRFYQNLLGLEYAMTLPVPFGTMHVLRFGSSAFKLIDPQKVPKKKNTGLENALGFRYVTFEVRQLSELCTTLAAADVEFVMPEQSFRPGVRIAMVADPDGNIIEFVERSES